jgi:group II intron maturase
VRRDVVAHVSASLGEMATACCASLTGASPVPVSIGAPGSRPQVVEGDLHTQAGYQMPVKWREPFIAALNPILRGWGQYFRTGNVEIRFNQLDTYVWRRLQRLRLARKGRNVQPGEVTRWSSEYFWNLGLYRLRGTGRYPESPFWESRNAAA